MFALFASASYHTLMHHSHEIQKKCILIDYQGIVFIIFASSSILIYNTFHQYIMLLIIYIYIIAFVSSLISIMIHDSKWDNIERKRQKFKNQRFLNFDHHFIKSTKSRFNNETF
jgi:predicted membrane channel-forming protein YqfA (hemolysin III family)